MMKKVRGVRYYYERTGSGTPLLLLHGFTGSTTTWAFLKEQLASRCLLIAVDLIGHGKTEKPADPKRYAMAETVHDLAALLDELHLDRIHVLGYSMGGRCALSFACMHPERVESLMIESASPGLEDEEHRRERRTHDRKLADFILRNGVEAFVDFWEQIALFRTQASLPPEKKQALRRQRLANDGRGLACSLIGMGTGAQPSWWARLNSLTMPVLLITGGRDDKFNRIASAMMERLPFAEWRAAEGAGHAVHLENEAAFTEQLTRFLGRTAERHAREGTDGDGR